MKQIVVMVGPPGSGKSTYAKKLYPDYTYINQDSQGKEGHYRYFLQAIAEEENIIVDRMNFNKEQRERYLAPARANGYETKIVVLHESQATCLERMLKREGHETIQDEKSARSAMHTFFTKYERPADTEADFVQRVWPYGYKPKCIVSDIDNTLANTSHREHFVTGPGKKNWKGFFDAMGEDSVNEWCNAILSASYNSDSVYEGPTTTILLVSARPENYRGLTTNWLTANFIPYHELIMRAAGDHREDSIVKEIIYEFEVITRYEVVFWLDDRKRVIEKIRSHGVTVLDCAGPKGDF